MWPQGKEVEEWGKSREETTWEGKREQWEPAGIDGNHRSMDGSMNFMKGKETVPARMMSS